MGKKNATRSQATTRVIRHARVADLERINEIYNHYVRTTPKTFDLAPMSTERRRAWFDWYTTRGPQQVFVVEEDDVVVAYADSHSFRERAAYNTTVEVTVYCAPEATGRGLGTMLYKALFEGLAGEDVWMAMAGITLPNPASVALHEHFGFTLVGVMHDVGRKFDRYWDVAWYEKRIGPQVD